MTPTRQEGGQTSTSVFLCQGLPLAELAGSPEDTEAWNKERAKGGERIQGPNGEFPGQPGILHSQLSILILSLLMDDENSNLRQARGREGTSLVMSCNIQR